ncbi:hypothetical protein F7725_007660 [Dissostichus mawsoni]|uniref:Uncharacterized protein n=1 Tax=Dissostichus mawsoni TaxID=36200 RepID=A0A7J5Y784_DISMA|nr:hypothetical protein F7725_007660 [Dissostichus mawsoni]
MMKTRAHGEDMMKTQAHGEDMMKTQTHEVRGKAETANIFGDSDDEDGLDSEAPLHYQQTMALSEPHTGSGHKIYNYKR